MSRRSDQLLRIEQALGRLEGVLGRVEHALDLAKPGGLSVVAADAKDAKTAAESAFVGMRTLASQATAKPGLPELTEAVGAHTDALRSMEATVRTATGPQPAVPVPAPPAVPPAASTKGKGATRGS